jgi:sec-independent protein translocase protein TatA
VRRAQTEVDMFGTLGMPELLIILAIVILIFGVNKLPKLGKGLGEGIRNFKDSVKQGQNEAKEPESPAPSETVDPK